MTKIIRVAQKLLLFNSKNQVLILRFNQEGDYAPDSLKGKWDFPGGGLRWEESLIDGLNREIKEEIGNIKFNLIKKDPILIWDWYHKSKGKNPDKRTICLLYEGKYLDGEIKLNLNEHDQFIWTEISNLLDFPWHKDDQKTIKKIQQLYISIS